MSLYRPHSKRRPGQTAGHSTFWILGLSSVMLWTNLHLLSLYVNKITPGWVENLSDGRKIVRGPFFYINLEFETCGVDI